MNENRARKLDGAEWSADDRGEGSPDACSPPLQLRSSNSRSAFYSRLLALLPISYPLFLRFPCCWAARYNSCPQPLPCFISSRFVYCIVRSLSFRISYFVRLPTVLLPSQLPFSILLFTIFPYIHLTSYGLLFLCFYLTFSFPHTPTFAVTSTLLHRFRFDSQSH